MSVEKLLQPRFLIIANYPGNELGELGEILDRDWAEYINGEDNPPSWRISDFPHLFKPLHWWEKREENEMPMYLKHSIDGVSFTYHKIEKWDMKTLFAYENVDERRGCSILTWLPEFTYQPATEQEYIDSLAKTVKAIIDESKRQMPTWLIGF